jgi:hypothetical protein
MHTSTWLILSTVLSLLTILVAYFGITRYLTLHFSSMDKLAESYKSLPEASKDDWVTVVTCVPKGEKKMKTTVKSLLDQTVKVNDISAVPEPGKEGISDSLKSVLKPLRAGKEYEGCQALVLAILCTKSDKTTLIWVKPGHVYGKDAIASMLQKAKEDPSRPVVSSCGRMAVVRPSHFDPSALDKCQATDAMDLIRDKCPEPVTMSLSETYPAMG